MSLTGYLLNSLWQFPVIALAIWVLVRLLARRDPLLRYRLWFAGLVLSVILPACPRPNSPTSQVQLPAHADQVIHSGDLDFVWLPSTAAFFEVLLGAFSVSVLFGSVRLGFGIFGTFHMAQTSLAASLPQPAVIRYEAMAKSLNLTSSPVLRLHMRIHSPATAGWRKPLILLPPSASSWLQSAGKQ